MVMIDCGRNNKGISSTKPLVHNFRKMISCWFYEFLKIFIWSIFHDFCCVCIASWVKIWLILAEMRSFLEITIFILFSLSLEWTSHLFIFWFLLHLLRQVWSLLIQITFKWSWRFVQVWFYSNLSLKFSLNCRCLLHLKLTENWYNLFKSILDKNRITIGVHLLLLMNLLS